MRLCSPYRLPSVLAVSALAVALALAAAPAQAKRAAPTRAVLLVGNNWDGTADIVDARTFKRVARINVVPDFKQRLAEIERDPAAALYFAAIRNLVGEGHNQLVDDLFTSRDGRRLFVSRPSLADVVAISLRTRRIVWRVKVDGNRADHMGISPDGRRLAVSASTARTVDVIDTRRGRIVGRFPSGDSPHENNFSRDGRRIYHASIGRVYTDDDAPGEDATKGDRIFEIVNARTLKVIRRIDFGRELAAFGLGVSAGVRPMAISPDERFVYVQLSFLHGFVEYDLRARRPTRVLIMPLSARAKHLSRTQYLLDSAHHGLTMNPRGTKLCAAATMSNYAAVVSRRTLTIDRRIAVGRRPYWAISSDDGRYCFVSVSGDDRVSVISYRTAREVARIRVGDHPQRMRMGAVRVGVLRR